MPAAIWPVGGERTCAWGEQVAIGVSCELDVISIGRGVAVGVWLAREMTGRAGDLCWIKLELSEAKDRTHGVV